MTIALPSRQPELHYAATLLFGEFLGLQFSLTNSPASTATEIKLPNGATLVLGDHFFHKYDSLAEFQIPATVAWVNKTQNPFLCQANLPVLFGEARLQVSEKKITCGIDVLATIFFMLSRWEEYANPARDKFQRFPASAALAVKNGFHQRPIVDEYVEMVWNMLTHLGIGQQRKRRSFRAVITHDVDFPLQWRSPFSLVKKLGGDLLKRKSPRQATRSLANYFNTKKGSEKDPFDTFDYLMDQSERQGLQSHFFFLCGGGHKNDEGHLPPRHPFMVDLMKKIDRRGHLIGFHPSFDTFNDGQLFKTELAELQRFSPQEIKAGRQHFLRFEVPTTWRIWEENGMAWDSSMYFPEMAGFRCGTCHPFPVFDILQRKMLKLREMPLTVMEVTFMVYQKKAPDEALAEILSLLQQVRQFNGSFVLLWHNTSFNAPEWRAYETRYESLMALF